MGFTFERRARSRKAKSGVRAWFGKPPTAAEIKDRLGRLLPRAWKGADVTITNKRITVALHAFVAPLSLRVLPEGELVVSGDASVGPGYIDDAMARLAPVLDELDYAWDPDAFDAQQLALTWLGEALRAGDTDLGMPEGRTFHVDAPIRTALGPRDAAWRDAVLADPALGRDAFAWWEARPGHLARSRALLAMWHEVPWRDPVDKDELAVMEKVDTQLTAARKADPQLELPYAEWAEIVGYLGDLLRADELRGHATGEATIGYRRYDMDVDLGDGWSITLPGAFVGAWEDDGERYWSTDGARMVEITTLETTEQDSSKLLEIAPAQHPIIERVADGARHARAEVHDSDGIHIVHGLVAVAPRVAIFTCKGPPEDEAWALATWRSLRHIAELPT
ncbi:MAG TPA: hypothetical protein VGC42_26695 [Kofleriaceae bacterium]